MKKKIKVGLIAMTAILAFCFIPPTTAKANDSDIALMWNYITSISGNLSISNGGTATVTGRGTAVETSVTKVSVHVSLQQYKSNRWTEIKSWSNTANGKTASIGTKNYAVAHGYSYRCVVTTKAYKGNSVLETGSKTINHGHFG